MEWRQWILKLLDDGFRRRCDNRFLPQVHRLNRILLLLYNFFCHCLSIATMDNTPVRLFGLILLNCHVSLPIIVS